MRDLYSQWKIASNKLYRAGFEDELRFNIFNNNFHAINEINQQQNDFTLALNEFADLTPAEFRMMYTGYNARQRTEDDSYSNFYLRDLPARVDWREKGAVAPVKNQGSCGSCWAFSAIGALETLYFVDHNELVLLSEQNIVDCVSGKGQSAGCNGGYMTDAFDYVADNGVQTAADYPYNARDGQCKFISSKALKVSSGYANVTMQSTTALKTALVAGSVSVAIQADQLVFQFYKTGVITKIANCGDDLNHGVLAVGYDTFNNIEAFIVKNSWGAAWGNNGYVLISTDGSANHGNGVCGILADSSYPTSH